MIRLLHFSNLSKKSNLDYSRVNPFDTLIQTSIFGPKNQLYIRVGPIFKKVLKALIKSLRFDSQEGKYVVFI